MYRPRSIWGSLGLLAALAGPRSIVAQYSRRLPTHVPVIDIGQQVPPLPALPPDPSTPGVFGAIVGGVVGLTAGGLVSYAFCEADGCRGGDVLLTLGAFTAAGALLGAVIDVACCGRAAGGRRRGLLGASHAVGRSGRLGVMGTASTSANPLPNVRCACRSGPPPVDRPSVGYEVPAVGAPADSALRR
jgi:hypothetical protein